jgi:hypothetical protein
MNPPFDLPENLILTTSITHWGGITLAWDASQGAWIGRAVIVAPSFGGLVRE